MAFYSNVEPFEESQGNVRDAPTSPDILKAYYKDMEKKEKEAALERKTSKRKSHSIFNRKSIKRASAAPSDQQRPPQRPGEKSTHPGDERGEMEKLEQKEKSDIISSLPSRSIVPEALKELPAWFNKEDWSPSTSYRIKYPIHNPVGPHYYRNHHLIPPSEYRPNARPPSVFSPSFPAMTSSFDRSEDTTRLPGPSRTPSNSPLPTPSSSQTRVADAGLKPRSRKTSHDGVDLMDVSDPWGTNWHHQSPYDVGIGHNTFSGEVHDSTNHPHTRSRRSSLTTRENRSKTVTPSPLSQSMSAIHLAPQSENDVRIPRKLSKRRAPIFGAWFNGNPKGSDTRSLAHSESNSPTTYGEEQRSASAFAALPPGKSDRRGSVLGRLAKRFSVVRKPPSAQQNASEEIPVSRQPSPEKQKRVPAPSIDEPLQPPGNPEPESDRRSSISVEAPYTIGKLMVANPDAPASETNTPLPETTTLPRNHSPTENSKIVQSPVPVHAPSSPQITLSPTSPISNNSFTETSPRRSVDDKPLPRPVVERKPVEKNMAVSPPPPAASKALAPPDVFDIGPPPPSATTKPITLPDLPNPPPPPSVTTKPIPLPITDNPLPALPVVIASPISLPDEPPIPPSSTTKPVPLPSSSSLPIPFPVEESTSRHSHLTVTDSGIDYSPLSAVSMLVNPPTPHRTDDMPMPSGSGSTPAPPPQSHPQSQSQLQQPVIHKRASSNHSKRSSREGKRDPSPGISSVKGRETETFKLVRSKSGNVYASNETITAAGEQWEVVENVQEKEGRSKSRSVSSISAHRDKESREKEGKESRESRKESRRQEKEREREREREKEREKEMERERQREKEESETAKRSSRSSRKHQSIEKHSHGQSSSDNPAEVGYKDEARSSRSRRSHDDDTYRERDRRERKSSRRTTQSASPDKKQAQAHAAAKASASASSPSTPNESTSVSRASLDRRPSTSARPTSEVPLVADLNAMRAKEAWEMERLYKARSLYGMDPNDNGAAPVVGPSAPVTDTKHASASDPTLNRSGSPSKGLHGSSHTSFMVSSPFPSNSAHQMYSSPPTIPSEASFSSPELLPLPVSHNPLPAPPRDVTTEYWTFANTGMAASH